MNEQVPSKDLVAYLEDRIRTHADDRVVDISMGRARAILDALRSTPEPEALRREQVKAICHALSGTCVMVTDPERQPCTIETCMTMEALARAAQPPGDGR